MSTQLLPMLRAQRIVHVPVPPDPMSFAEMSGEVPTTPHFRTVDVEVLGYDDSEQVLVARFEYRGHRSPPVALTYWMTRADILLGMASIP